MDKARSSTPITDSPDRPQCASVWFGRLERALICGDLIYAAKADRELRRLGYALRYSLIPATGRTTSGPRDE